MGFFKKESNKKSGRLRRTLIVTSALMLFMSFAPAMANNQAFDNVMGIETAYAATTTQSDRWVDAGNSVWKLKTSDGAGYVSNSWFQDLDGSWYMIGADGTMLSGLITDQSTGKSYLMNISHDGYFGKMLTVDGVYNLNGQQVYLTFDQAHVGSFGAILSGLDNARSAGVSEKALASIPTDSAGGGTGPAGGQVQKPEVPENKGNGGQFTEGGFELPTPGPIKNQVTPDGTSDISQGTLDNIKDATYY